MMSNLPAGLHPQIYGLYEWVAEIDATAATIESRVVKVVEDTVNLGMQDAVDNAPEDSGRLKRDIMESADTTVQGDVVHGEYGTNLEYGEYQEYGWADVPPKFFFRNSFDKALPYFDNQLNLISFGR